MNCDLREHEAAIAHICLFSNDSCLHVAFLQELFVPPSFPGGFLCPCLGRVLGEHRNFTSL